MNYYKRIPRNPFYGDGLCLRDEQNLKEAVEFRDAVFSRNSELVCKAVNKTRLRGVTLKYNDIFNSAQDIDPTLTSEEWDKLLEDIWCKEKRVWRFSIYHHLKFVDIVGN